MHALESQNDPIYQNLREIWNGRRAEPKPNSEYKACGKNVIVMGTLCSRFD